jgi:hypothetical protein
LGALKNVLQEDVADKVIAGCEEKMRRTVKEMDLDSFDSFARRQSLTAGIVLFRIYPQPFL